MTLSDVKIVCRLLMSASIALPGSDQVGQHRSYILPNRDRPASQPPQRHGRQYRSNGPRGDA